MVKAKDGEEALKAVEGNVEVGICSIEEGGLGLRRRVIAGGG